MKKLALAIAALFFAAAAHAQNSGTVTNHAFAIGKGAGVSGYTSLLCGAGQLAVAQAGADPICRTVSGDWTLNAAGVSTLATVNGNVGTFGSATQSVVFTVNAKGLITAAANVTVTPALASITGLGAGVPAALAIATGSAGAPVLFNGALGTPSSGVGTNLTALNATNLGSGTIPAARLGGLSVITNSLGADVAMNNTSNYFDGPTVAQGTSGTWFASGTATFRNTSTAAGVYCKLWDGTTVIASGSMSTAAINFAGSISLSGPLASPAGNIRISCRDTGSTSGSMLFNLTGNSKDSTVTAFRIN